MLRPLLTPLCRGCLRRLLLSLSAPVLSGGFKHFLRMLTSLSGDLDAAEHACQLFYAVSRGQLSKGGACGLADSQHRHTKKVVPLRRHLRQVSHAQHLPTRAECAQLAANILGDSPADTGVDLVKHH